LAEINVVGAGLSGLVAAINCARSGHDVTVLERYERVGGEPVAHPGVDGTIMQPEILGRFIGVELKAPQVTPMEEIEFFMYGKKFEFDPVRYSGHLVERGARSTSIENYLYEIALKEGVKFEFGWELRSKADLSQLPPNSIIASGLNEEVFKLFAIPYRKYNCLIAVKRYDGPTRVLAWFDRYTNDYCYCGNTNGLALALYFKHEGPVEEGGFEKWRTGHLLERTGIEFNNFRSHDCAVGNIAFNNQNLFYDNKILAGTLAGVNDALFSFGVVSSLITGRIAALAVDDRAKARELFDDLVSMLKYALFLKKLSDATPHAIKEPVLKAAFVPISALSPLQGLMNLVVPGFTKLKKWC
jgi:hypothetical protein